MGLTSITARLPEKGIAAVCEIDLTPFMGETASGERNEENVLRFREPRTSDMFTNPQRAKRLKVRYPTFSDTLNGQILTIASCYIPGKDEAAGVDIDNAIADLAATQRDVFLFLFNKFNEAFPFGNLGAAEDDAGNE